MNDQLSELNEAQRLAVEKTEGPVMIIAGAGSGKTKVLTCRVANLINKGVDPTNILSLTFTNKAANEMKHRIRNIVGDKADKLLMGTFHSVLAKILRIESDKLGYSSNFTIYDQIDSSKVITDIINEMQLDKDIYKVKFVQNRISLLKNNLITVEEYYHNRELQKQDIYSKRVKMGEVYQKYINTCFNASAMDFDDILLKANELFHTDSETLIKYQNRFKYIMVDEYQDTNHCQYLIVKTLSEKYKNICVVGDDAQSIYSFRGANIQNILNFKTDYKDVSVFNLEQNYRSTKNIVGAANSIIKNNTEQLDKNIWSDNNSGEKLGVFKAFNSNEEGDFVARSIIDNIQDRNNFKNFAVLYRTNSQSRAIEDGLRKKNIPYKIYGGTSFYQRKEIKDIVAYLRLITNLKDDEALKRSINYPARGIGDTTLEKLTKVSLEYGKPIFEVIENIDELDININSGTRNKLRGFYNMISEFRDESKDKNAFEITDYILNTTGLAKELHGDLTIEGRNRYENVKELIGSIKIFCASRASMDREASISQFLEEVYLATDYDNDNNSENKVSLMTIHMSKGLEFDTVFIVGMENNLFPSRLSTSLPEEIEEERRLFYVAITRSKRKVYMSYTQSRIQWGTVTNPSPSIFLKEIDKKYLELLNIDRIGGESSGDSSSSYRSFGTNSKYKRPYRRY
ncbi:ATP-dependent helicase [Ichthyobacterium seriolicida]|uniref:DNA 3'-5' helicase n=1 Tax=Ichthyobacterium seriolicida TaxID=242600 RepID=A0A1J1E9E1_9FLAO|nr:UvrD-helicase domain-containing protein [Ichthyobacterium seriolicida]BAV94523.1 ATP-dependent DNA helicase [Ichthyobacterium seriolicida]